MRIFSIIFFIFFISGTWAQTDLALSCKTFKDLSPDEKTRLQGLLTAYREPYKLQKHNEALPIWKEIYDLAPGNNGKNKGFFDDGVNMYASIMKSASVNIQKPYADTIKMIHAQREACFGMDGKYMGQKAFDYYFHLKPFVDEEETYVMFNKAVEMNNGRMDYFTVNPFMSLIKARYTSGKEKASEVGRLSYIAYQSLTEGQKTCTGNICESWKKVAEYSGKMIEEFETSAIPFPAAYFLDKYHGLYLKSPQDCAVIKQAYKKMTDAKVDVDDQKYAEVKNAVEGCK